LVMGCSAMVGTHELMHQYWLNRVRLLSLYEFALHFFLAVAPSAALHWCQTPSAALSPGTEMDYG
jgi:hypothetical protein